MAGFFGLGRSSRVYLDGMIKATVYVPSPLIVTGVVIAIFSDCET